MSQPPQYSYLAGYATSSLKGFVTSIVMPILLIFVGYKVIPPALEAYEEHSIAKAVELYEDYAHDKALEKAKALMASEDPSTEVAKTLTELRTSGVKGTKDAIDIAVMVIRTPSLGNSGKAQAMEFLASVGISLEGIDLGCQRMGGSENWDSEAKGCIETVHLCCADLRKIDLSNAYLSRVRFDKTDLQGANLQSAKLWGATFIDTNLQSANLRFAKLQGATFIGTNLQGADLGIAFLQGANLDRANLQGAYLSGSEAQGANFIGADLQGAVLGTADMQDANLTSANLQGITLYGDLRGAILDGANLQSTDLRGANLRKAKLTGADLSYADLREVDLSFVDLQDTKLREARLQGVELWKVNLQGADLSGADFNDVKFKGSSDFTNAWAWADQSPVGLDLSRINLCMFDDEQHDRLDRPDPCIPPTPDTPKAE